MGTLNQWVQGSLVPGASTGVNDGSGLKYLLTDHREALLHLALFKARSLGSVACPLALRRVAVTDASGTLISQQRYLPFGQVRTDVTSPNSSPTDFAFTGQRNLDAQGNVSLGLMDYHAKMYDDSFL